MTMSSQSRRTSAAGEDTEGQEIPYTFPTTASGDLTVIQRLISDGSETPLTETTDYTATYGASGGTVTLVDAIADTYEIHVIRDTDMTQTLDLETGGDYSAVNIEAALDKNTRLIVENADEVSRAIRAPATDALAIDMELPDSITRASKSLGFDSSGNVTVTDSDGNFESVNAYWDNLVVKSTPYLDVKAYGAEGDGSTNDTAAIQAALDAAPDNGGVILFPPGTYNHTGLTADAKSMMVGCGSETTILNCTASSGHGITFGDNNYGGGMRGFKLTTSRGTSTGAAMALGAWNYGIFENIKITGKWSQGIHMSGAVGNVFKAIAIQDYGVTAANITRGVDLTSASSNNSFYRLIVRGSTISVYIQSGDGNTFFDCEVGYTDNAAGSYGYKLIDNANRNRIVLGWIESTETAISIGESLDISCYDNVILLPFATAVDDAIVVDGGTGTTILALDVLGGVDVPWQKIGRQAIWSTTSDPSWAAWDTDEDGRIWFNSGFNRMKYWNGSAVRDIVSSQDVVSYENESVFYENDLVLI